MLMVSLEVVRLLEIVFETVERNHFLSVLDRFSSSNLLELYKISNNFELKKVIIEAYVIRAEGLKEREKQLILSYNDKIGYNDKIKTLEIYAAESDEWEDVVLLLYRLEENSYTKISILRIFANFSNSGIVKVEKLVELYNKESRFETELLGIIKQASQQLSQEDLNFLCHKYGKDNFLLVIWCGLKQKSLSYNRIEEKNNNLESSLILTDATTTQRSITASANPPF